MSKVRREMNSVSRKQAFRQLPLALLPMLVAGPVWAQQRDSVVVRAVSVWQKDVDQLRMDILTQRRMELEYQKMLSALQVRLSVAEADSNRSGLQAQSQFVYNRLREANAEQFRLRRKLELLCMEVRKPEGWLGVTTMGPQMENMRVDGTKVIKFLELPVVASVDPGSPADRVGVRAGDVLVEIGGRQLLRENVVFADMLRPGVVVVMKVQRGQDVVTLSPTVEPLPEVTTGTSCTYVDPAVAYIVAPSPGQAQVRIQKTQDGQGYSYAYARPRRDSSAVVASTTPVPAASGAFAGPMAAYFGGGASVLAGLQLVTLSPETSRLLGVTHGILVNQVLTGTMGQEAGLRGGDILVSADSQDLRSIAVLQRVINRANDRIVTIVIVRDRKRETVQLRW